MTEPVDIEDARRRSVFTEDEVVDLVRRVVDGEPDALSLLLLHRECRP